MHLHVATIAAEIDPPRARGDVSAIDSVLYPRCDLFARPAPSFTWRLSKHAIEHDYLLIVQERPCANALLLLPLDPNKT